MFGKSKTTNNASLEDMQLLMDAMDGVIGGQYDDIDISVFHNPAYGEKFNELIHAFKKSNNNFVMRMNESMRTLGDNSYVKKMLDQVESQAKSVEDMEESSRTLENSIQNISESVSGIQDYSREALVTVENGVTNMNESIKVVTESSDKLKVLNEQVKAFQDKIDKIGEIVDVVKQVAGQSNLLALNASIEAARAGEAGKGFAVVADQVRELSNNTSESAGDIVRYVTELRADISALVQSMDDTTMSLAEGNEKVESSLADIQKMGEQMKQIGDKIDSVFTDIDNQTQVTRQFNQQVEGISESYRVLADDCTKTGTHLFRCGRNIDVCRSDMVRGFAEITQQDWLNVFSIDHFILMWRVYNNAVDFEHLKKTQLNNPTSCKIGKWLAAQTDPNIKNSAEFKRVYDTHNEVHKWATRSWEEKDAGNQQGALEFFQRTYDAYYEYDKAINALKAKMKQLGYKDETEIVIFSALK